MVTVTHRPGNLGLQAVETSFLSTCQTIDYMDQDGSSCALPTHTITRKNGSPVKDNVVTSPRNRSMEQMDLQRTEGLFVKAVIELCRHHIAGRSSAGKRNLNGKEEAFAENVQ